MNNQNLNGLQDQTFGTTGTQPSLYGDGSDRPAIAMGRTHQGGIVSAMFDTDEEARNAVSSLRSMGVTDGHLSLITQHRGTTTTANADGDVVDEEHTSLLRGIFGGGALGAGLGVAALAIPGVGPLVAAGAIAAAAVPSAVAIGAVAGAALGTLNETLKSHGVSDDDASYYGERMNGQGVLVTVDVQELSRERIEEVLYSAGGHNASRAR